MYLYRRMRVVITLQKNEIEQFTRQVQTRTTSYNNIIYIDIDPRSIRNRIIINKSNVSANKM